MTLLLIAIATFVSTVLGGWFALRMRDKLHLILGFSAGAIIAVTFFDLLPEAIELAGEGASGTVTSLAALGFMVYMVLDRTVVLHAGADEGLGGHQHRGRLGASTLAIHSFIDGAAIGLAFQVSASVGAVVAVAVLAHDFSDGINTVNLVVKNGGTRKEAWRWLLLDGLAPVLGVATTFFVSIPSHTLGQLLALFSGFFLYIGASDLLPESYHSHPTRWSTAMTLLGAGVIYGVIKLAGI